MSSFDALQKRIAALPPGKAKEYSQMLNLLIDRGASDAWMFKFVQRLERAEFLTGRLHHTPATRLR